MINHTGVEIKFNNQADALRAVSETHQAASAEFHQTFY